ncbi:NAD-dependent epimerase/dehydratase family protein [Microbulbifer sediminum]|uniref:NAD-dependent epimerase/dehydratase family protein n=1 Tax=Microbulbifer sediminum TaxID=2904250 RepID=UPI001F0158B6|nr:NAD-dependent epimerase/dehydratase family protein [Microbulbifer sediminum]
MNRAIVIGATGLVGSALVDRLARSESIQSVITITRRPAPHPSDKVDNRVVDFEQLAAHPTLFQGDMLFSCLGTTRRQAGSLQAQRRVDLDYQFQAAELAAANGVRHYLLVSSSGANAESRSGYLKMKGELERRVQRLAFPRVSIFQPSLLLGSRDHLRMGEQLAALVLPALCRLPGLRRYRPIRGEQVAARMLEVALSPGSGVQTFTLDEVFPSSDTA